LYRSHCIDCHENDGRGEASRELMDSIPDFTKPEWHRARSNDRLVRSISEGKGQMPAMKGKLAKMEVVELVALVRNFREGQQVLPDDSEEDFNPPAPLEPDNSSLKGVASSSAQPLLSVPSTTDPPENAQNALVQGVFRRLCISCHGQDGRGDALRGRIPRMPDFTSRVWQGRRSDAEMNCSILEGKGTAMPSFRGKLGDAQARDLVAYLRSMASTPTRSTPRSTAEFRRRFQQLREQMEHLDRQYQALSSRERTASEQPADKDVQTRE
jgi:mono/diheme cytochrome c family protein